MRKVFLFILVFLFIISINYGKEKSILENNGVDWLESDKLYRLGYVTGIISGLGIAETATSFVSYILKDEGMKEIYKKKWEEIYLYNITVGQIIDGVNNFYKDFSNRRIKIVDAIFIVNMQIKGKDQELINAQIRYLKMQPISQDLFNNIMDRLMKFAKKKGKGTIVRLYPTYKEIEDREFSKEDLLKIAVFISENNAINDLFCYGEYK